MNWFIRNTTRMEEFIWNTIGTGFFSVQAALILIVISRQYGIEIAGIVTFAYAYATLIYSVSRWGMRNFQSSDLEEKYSFKNYVGARAVTCILSVGFTVVFLGIQFVSGGYSSEKIQIILGITILKTIDAFGDVLYGRLQQKDIFIAGAKMMAIQQISVTALIVILSLAKIPMCFLFYIVDIFAILILVFLGMMVRLELSVEKTRVSKKTILAMLKECLPLNVGLALSVYISNIPKYAIDMYMDEKTQAIMGYIMLPVFVVTLFSQFLYQPFIRELAYFWETHQLKKLVKKMCIQIVCILVCTVVVLLVCWTVGLNILSWLYHVDLLAYRGVFTIYLCGGALFALAFYLNVVLTIMRFQSSIAIGYLVATFCAILMQKKLAINYGVYGIAWLYLGVNAILFGFFLVAIIGRWLRRLDNH